MPIDNPFLVPASVLVLGIAGQWISWRIGLPSILVLLILGIVAGNVGLVDTDALLGPLLRPVVSFSVALILFEGSLGLETSALKQIGRVVWNLNSIGVIITWLLSAAAAYYIMGWTYDLALLFGAIITVTGPTAVLPLLVHVRPAGQITHILKWEGILIAPVGSMIAILTMETIIATQGFSTIAMNIVLAIMKVVIIGGATGLIGALFVAVPIRKNWMPDNLPNLIALMTVVGVFTLSNILQNDSGFVAVTVMGITLANQRIADIRHIVEFKENLRLLLLSTLFILLAARLDIQDLRLLGWNSAWFMLVLILVVRPISVIVSSFKSNLAWNEIAFLSFLAPRGIVAASISAVFALELAERGFAGTEKLVPMVFLVILATVTFCSLAAIPVANMLGITGNPQGLLIVGAHPWSRAVAIALKELEFRVVLADTNLINIMNARKDDIETYYGDVLTDYFVDEADLTDIGHLLAATPNNRVNTLAALHMIDTFGKEEVYQLPSTQIKRDQLGVDHVPMQLQGKKVFRDDANFQMITSLYQQNSKILTIEIDKEFELETLNKEYTAPPLPLFVIDTTGRLMPYTIENPPVLKPEQKLLVMVQEN